MNKIDAKLRKSQIMSFDDQAQKMKKLLKEIKQPKGGWIHYIRKLHFMTATQLAKRMNITQAALSQIEKGEAEGRVNLSTMKSAADALNSELFYMLVPREKIMETLRRQVESAATKIYDQTEKHMALEAQSSSKKHRQDAIDEITQELFLELSPKIWKDGSDK